MKWHSQYWQFKNKNIVQLWSTLRIRYILQDQIFTQDLVLYVKLNKHINANLYKYAILLNKWKFYMYTKELFKKMS